MTAHKTFEEGQKFGLVLIEGGEERVPDDATEEFCKGVDDVAFECECGWWCCVSEQHSGNRCGDCAPDDED